VVFGDADVARAAEGIAQAAFFNAGQDCTAATRALVHESVYEEFVAALVAQAGTLRPGTPDDPDAFYGALNNVHHFGRVMEK
ncbi:aldehyde dehydrogenase family protein, partial [Mycobacterium kansasii]